MYHYLIADDEPLIRKGTIKKIEKLSLPVSCSYEASNGAEAIDYLINHSVDFIITDMDMPQMDGIDFLEILNHQFPDIPIIVISAYASFNYMQKSIQSGAVNYILKPFQKEDIEKTLFQVIERLKDQKMKRMGDIHDLIHFTLGEQSQIGLTLAEAILRKHPTIKLIITDKILNHSILSAELPGTNYFIHFITYTQQESIDFSSLNLCIISNSVTSANCFVEAYQLMMDHYNMTPINQLTSPVLVSDSLNNQTLFSEFKQTELFNLLENGDSGKLKVSLESYFDYLVNENASLFSIKLCITDLLFLTKKLINLNTQKITNYTLPKEEKYIMEKLFTVQETATYGIELLTNLASSLSFQNVYDSDDMVENIKKYIQTNYNNQNLSLDLLADTFFLHPVYLSKIFKESTGIKFTEYINTIRIMEAKKLLKTTTKKVSQISKLVGYDNEKYFFRIFKKIENKTPEQFRKAF